MQISILQKVENTITKIQLVSKKQGVQTNKEEKERQKIVSSPLTTH